MAQNVYVDTSGFKFKSNRVKLAFAKAAREELLKGAQTIYQGAAANLKGPGIPKKTSRTGTQYPDYDKRPGYDTSKMPIARVTGTLARSLTLTPLSTLAYAIWADPRIAKYAKFVHDGRKGRVPRRFIFDVVRSKRSAIIKALNTALKSAIRSAS